MQIRSMLARNYRSLRAIRMEMGDVNLFIGENGVGKSNLYRALQLIQAAVRGSFSLEIAREGGMSSALWSGKRRSGDPARIHLEAELLDEERAISFSYRIECGLKPPLGAGFAFEPQIKEEELSIETGRRPVSMMKRKGPAIFVRNDAGRMEEHPEKALPSETAVSLLGDAGHYPEIGGFRRTVENWRFFHGFRTDRDSELRLPCLAVTAPMLDEDGRNLAAVYATLRHTREDTTDLDRAVAMAFNGAWLDLPEPGQFAEFGLVFPDFPQRVFSARELSDGQLRFLALAAALLSYRRPRFIALNEPETSLHPDMLPALASMIESAAKESQVWVVTHSQVLTDAVSDLCGVRARRVIRPDGATSIEGLSLTGTIGDDE